MAINNRYRIWINGVAAMVMLVVVLLPLLLSQRIQKSLVREEQAKIALWAAATEALVGDDEAAPYGVLLQIISGNSTIPVILTDEGGNIISYNNIHLPTGVDSLQYVRKQLARYEAKYPPVTIDLGQSGVQYLYYGDSSTLKTLYQFPLIQLPIFLFFLILLATAWQMAISYSKNRLWAGLSRETAHQLGTPISSLLAWIELLRDEQVDEHMLSEMETDVKRLERISHRFQRFGSNPPHERCDLREIVAEATEYLRLRISEGVHFFLQLPDMPLYIATNCTLMSWVIENLVKNGVDAMEGEGQLTIALSLKGRYAVLDVSDTGKGIPKASRRKLFRTGYTTKRNGWGLGLTLARRIVHEYHRGKLYLLRSEVGLGSTFRIKIPLA